MTVARVYLDACIVIYFVQRHPRYAERITRALHLAAAIHARCDEFWTNDDRLAKAAEGRISVVAFDQTK